MRLEGIVTARLRNQHLSVPRDGSAADLVAWMGAVQAQEYEPARWGLGQRLAGRPVSSAIETEIASGAILRTHAMRPTWHFVAAEDIGWMQALTGPHVQRRMATYLRYFELDAKTLTRALGWIERALGDGACLTRAEIARALQRGRITASHQRLAHIVMHAELDGLICSGPRRERQFTYSLVSGRVRRARQLAGDEALAELTKRYFQSHGPATVRDFVWWSGLATADAKRGVEIIRAESMTSAGLKYWWCEPDSGAQVRESRRRRWETPAAHLLPIYDEYLVAYRDRVAVSHGASLIKERQRSVIFQHAILIDGHVAGTWRTAAGSAKSPDLVPMRRFSAAERRAVDDAFDRYRRFVAS